MFDKYYVGSDLIASSNNGKYKPVSRVTLAVDENKVITAGDDSGFELYAHCRGATQEMVNELLNRLRGYTYQAFEADEANLNPSAELGDGITAGGVYGVISKIRDDGSGYVSVSAPGEAELEDEYPMEGPGTRMFNRELAKAYSLISKTSEEIRMEVFGEDGYTGSSIVSQLGLILNQVTGKIGEDEATSLIKTALEGIEISISNNTAGTSASITLSYTDDDSTKIDIASGTINLTGLVTISSLENGTTAIDGGCIKTDSLTAEALHLSGMLTVYSGSYSYGEENIGGYIGYDSGFNGAKGIGIRSKEELSQVVCTDAAARISYGDLYGISQVVCSPNSVLVEGLNLIQMATYGITRLNVDSDGIYPSGANYTCGTADLPWQDVYAAGTSFSALVARVEALEK